MTTSQKNRLLASRFSAGLMIAILAVPALAGPCANYAGGLRQAQIQRITMQQNQMKMGIDGIGSISKQLSMGCWDQVVGIDMGSFGMPPVMAKMTIRKLNEACEAAVQKAVQMANQKIGNVTGQISGAMDFGGNSGMLSQLSSAWNGLSSQDKADALSALDSMSPGSGAAFLQAQQASGGMPSLPTGSGSLGTGLGPVTTSGTKGILSQVGEFFSPSGN